MALSLVVSVGAALLAAVPARATTAGASTSTGSGRAVLVQLTSSLLGNATIDDTGTVTVPGNVDRPLANVSGVVSGSVADAQVNASPGQVAASASVANLTIGGVTLPLLGQLLPVITFRAVVASAAATCTSATGTSQIEYLAVGGIPLISAKTAAAPNTVLNAGLAKVVLNEQIAAKGPGFGIIVNAAHITVAGLLDVVIAGANTNLLCPPVVTAVSPTIGPAAGGNLVTVTGANLAGASEVDFGSTKVTTGIVVNPQGSTLSVDAPPGTGTVDVQVVTPGGKSATSPADRYSYQLPPSTPYTQAHLILSPANAGPDTPHFPQALTATLTDRFAKPLPNMVIPFSVTGANPTNGTANTNAVGIATFTYTGAHPGSDTVKATFTAGNDTAVSNPAIVTWATPGPISTISTSTVAGNFYPSAAGATAFTAKPGDNPAFGQTFPDIAFNPPAGTIPHNLSSVDSTTRPFTDITTDVLGDYAGTIAAQGNGQSAGVAGLNSFNAVFTANFQVSKPSDVTFDVLADDGFLLGIAGGASRVNGSYENAPASNMSPFNSYPLVGAFNQPSPNGPATYPVTVHFPTAGNYPYELDYFSCCGQQLSLTMTVATVTAQVAPLSIYVGYADGVRPAGSIFPFPWQGSPNITFVGGGTFDAGALRFDNNTNSPITFDSITVDIGGNHYDIWPHSQNVPPHQILILTQTFSYNFDTSDINGTGCGQNSGLIPQVHVTIAGQATTYADTSEVLNTHGYDLACQGNESTSWHLIGGSTATPPPGPPIPPAGTLALNPANSTQQTVGQTDLVTVAAMDATGQPIANLPVTIGVFGPNSRQLISNTDVGGNASFSYVGSNAGTDTLSATAFVGGLRLVSNTANITWNIPVPGGPPTGGTPGQAPPAITTPSPANGSLVTAPTPVSASFVAPSGQSIVSWKVSEQPDRPGSVASTLGSGSGAPPATLGTFDPTLLPNGTYTITISATASGGGTQNLPTDVSVTGNLKLSRYVTTYQDLSVPVNGFQMEVRRSYDSSDKTVGDFGVGWHLSLSNFAVTTNRELGAGGWSQYDPACFGALCLTAYKSSAPHFVSVTFPDGHAEVFDFTPQGGSVLFPTIGAAFTARPGTGTTSTLASSEPIQGLTAAGDLVDGSGNPYDPHRFTLTTHDGRVLVLDKILGLVSETDPNGNSLTVDSTGVHASSGQSVTFRRDGLNRVSDGTGPGGEHVHYDYTAAGDLADSVDANGSTTTYGYDPGHYLSSASGPDGRAVQTLRYDPNGRLASVTDAEGHTTTIATNLNTRTQTVLDANGKLTTVNTYDNLGDLLQQDQVFNGQTLSTSLTYDPDGRPTHQKDPTGAQRSASYDPAGNLATTTDALGATTRIDHDAFGQTIAVVGPLGTLQTLTYDAHGNPASISSGDGSKTVFGYDGAGRLATVADPVGNQESFSYDAGGHLASFKDALGFTTLVKADPSGRVLSITDPNGGSTSYGRDHAGNIIQVTDPDHVSRTFGYNYVGQQTSMTDAFGNVERSTFGPDGLLQSRTDRQGTVTTYTYDADGRLIGEAPAGAAPTTFSYDPLGRLIQAVNETSTLGFSYDNASRVLVETSQPRPGSPAATATVTHTYDPAGNLASTTSAAGATRYGYDLGSRPTSVTDPSGGSFTIGYDLASRMTGLARPNGVNDQLTYTDGGLLASRTASLGPTVIFGVSYQYDANGHRLTASDPTGVTTYTHDPLGRLTTVSFPGGQQSYSYDAAGNLMSSPTSPAGTVTYNQDRLIGNASASYSWDNNGRLATTQARGASQPTTYGWNARDQLVSVVPPTGAPITFAYDPFGRRLATTGPGGRTTYSYDGLNLDAINAGPANQSLVSLPGLDQNLEQTQGGTTSFPITDGLNSPRVLTDATGAVQGTVSYDAYGKVTATQGTSNPLTFTSRPSDPATGLIDERARSYDPATGRFISEDPVQSANPYPYARNDPVDFVDPTGSLAIEVAAIQSLSAFQLHIAQLYSHIDRCLGASLIVGLSGAFGSVGQANSPPQSGIISGAKDVWNDIKGSQEGTALILAAPKATQGFFALFPDAEPKFLPTGGSPISVLMALYSEMGLDQQAAHGVASCGGTDFARDLIPLL